MTAPCNSTLFLTPPLSLSLHIPYPRRIFPFPSSNVQRTVRGAATALLSGHSVKGGMLEMIRGSLRWLLEDFLKTTYLSLAQASE